MSQKHKNVLKQLFPVELGENHDLDLTIEGDHLDQVQASGEVLLANAYPDTTLELLSAWERHLGLSPDESASDAERVAACVAKFKALGGLSVPYFTQIAADRGYIIEIAEPQPFMAGIGRAGDKIYDPDVIFCWRVIIDSAANIEDIFQDLKPAHTYVYFEYIYYEDFTTYIEQDPNSHIDVASQEITFENLDYNEDAWVRKDFGVDYFSGDFVHKLEARATGSAPSGSYPQAHIWALTNVIDDTYGIEVGGGDFLSLLIYYTPTGVNPRLMLRGCNSGAMYSSANYLIEEDKPYYLTIHRDESAGLFGTLYCYVYSDYFRTELLTTLSLVLYVSKKDFRYLFALNSYNYGTTPVPLSGEVSNLQLVA